MTRPGDPDALPAEPKPLILVVDDDPVPCSTISRMVGTLGYSVRCCSSGAAALTSLREVPGAVRLVLAEMGMPGMDGGELAERLQDFDPRLPVVLMAARDDPYVGELRAGYADFPFLSKPIGLADLRDVLGSYVASGRPAVIGGATTTERASSLAWRRGLAWIRSGRFERAFIRRLGRAARAVTAASRMMDAPRRRDQVGTGGQVRGL